MMMITVHHTVHLYSTQPTTNHHHQQQQCQFLLSFKVSVSLLYSGPVAVHDTTLKPPACLPYETPRGEM